MWQAEWEDEASARYPTGVSWLLEFRLLAECAGTRSSELLSRLGLAEGWSYARINHKAPKKSRNEWLAAEIRCRMFRCQTSLF